MNRKELEEKLDEHQREADRLGALAARLSQGKGWFRPPPIEDVRMSTRALEEQRQHIEAVLEIRYQLSKL
jgi:hypothetical protein